MRLQRLPPPDTRKMGAPPAASHSQGFDRPDWFGPSTARRPVTLAKPLVAHGFGGDGREACEKPRSQKYYRRECGCRPCATGKQQTHGGAPTKDAGRDSNGPLSERRERRVLFQN